MKKTLAILLALSLMLVMLVACGETTPATTTADAVTTADAPANTDAPETDAPETDDPEVTTTEAPETTEEVVELEPYTDATVVYLATGGKGNGSSADSPVSNLAAALDCLDLTKDCTVVICDYFMLDTTFVYTETFEGTVTITSNYDGVDYRDAGAEFAAMACRFVCSGEYVVRDVDFTLLGNFLFFIANHYPITIDTGVTMTSMSLDFNGSSFANAFGILGGYQNGRPVVVGGELPPVETDADVNITVNSGINFSIGAYSRQIENAVNTGTATINIGGDALVTRLYLTPCNKPFTSGNVIVNVTDNANVTNIYGATSVGTSDGATINWLGGTIGMYADVLQDTHELIATNGVHLVHTEAVKADANFATVSAEFDSVTQQ